MKRLLKKIPFIGARKSDPPVESLSEVSLEGLETLVADLEKEWDDSPFHHWAQGLDTSPRNPYYIYIELTNACNFRCVHCPHVTMERPVGLMDVAKYRTLLEEMKGLVAALGLFKQGESLLHPNFVEMFRYAKQQGFKVDLFSNASRMDEKISRVLVEDGLDFITFTLSGSKETYEKVHLKGNWEVTLQNIATLVKLKRRAGSTRPHINVHMVRYPNTPAEEIRNFERIFKEEIPVDSVTYNNLIYYPGVFDQGQASDGFPPDPDTYRPCIFPWQLFGISWDGTAVPCIFDGDERAKIGNVFEDGFLGVWQGEKLRAFRRDLVARTFQYRSKEPHLCTTCSILWDPCQQTAANFARSYVGDDKLERAEGHLKGILMAYPGNLEARWGMGLIHMIKGSVKEAMAEWHKVMEVEPYGALALKVKKNLHLVIKSPILT